MPSVSIRTRLFIAFTLMVLLPVAATGTVGYLGGEQRDRQNAFSRLETVARFGESTISNWLENLQSELANALNTEESRANVSTLLQEASPALLRSAARRELRDRLRLSITQRPLFEELFLMDIQGKVVLSSDATQEGKVYNSIAFFQRGLEGPYVNPAYYSTSLGHMAVVVARPVVDAQGQAVGVLAGRASLEQLNEMLLERSGLGETGEAYLVGADYTLLTALRYGEEGGRIHTQGTETAIENHTHGSRLYEGYQGEPVVGSYRWLPGLQAALLVEQAQAEALASTYSSLRVIGGIALLSLSVAMVTSWLVTRSIANPLRDMVDDAKRIAAGDLAHHLTATRADEIGSLAQAFNSMTAQLHDLISSLEQRVTDRTRELERRSAYLEASAEVGRTASSILDAEELIQQTVELIHEQFGLYYVGLFLLDAAGEWAVLRGGSGEAGQMMLARGHRIRVGEGMIGLSIARARARVSLEAGGITERLATPELPDTRSAASLPLRSRGQVIGALTVQSDQPGAFDEDTVVVLQTVADMVAVALDNAYLFAEGQEALEASSRAYGEASREAWGKLLHVEPDLGYRSGVRGVTGARDIWRSEMEDALQTGETIQRMQAIHGNGVDVGDRLPLAVPIKVRGEVIGVLDTYKPADAGKWTADEIALLETLAGQLGIAVEGARLYEEAQRRATREQVTREITDKMRRATDVEAIVQTAVDELFEILGTSRAFVHLGAGPSTQDDRAASLPSTVEGAASLPSTVEGAASLPSTVEGAASLPFTVDGNDSHNR